MTEVYYQVLDFPLANKVLKLQWRQYMNFNYVINYTLDGYNNKNVWDSDYLKILSFFKKIPSNPSPLSLHF